MKSNLIAAISLATLALLGATSANAALPAIPYVSYLTIESDLNVEDGDNNVESSAGAQQVADYPKGGDAGECEAEKVGYNAPCL